MGRKKFNSCFNSVYVDLLITIGHNEYINYSEIGRILNKNSDTVIKQSRILINRGLITAKKINYRNATNLKITHKGRDMILDYFLVKNLESQIKLIKDKWVIK